jgi:hypothetical protein
MISLVLAVAIGTAQPCLAPPVIHHHGHRAHVPQPVQSCVTPPVPMCFREPDTEPDILPIAAPLIYYTSPPLADDTPPAGETSQDEPPIIAGGGVIVLGTTGIYAPIGGGDTPVPPGGYSPPPVGTPCCATPPTRAPEMNGPGAAGALTLLLGCVAVLRGRRRA